MPMPRNTEKFDAAAAGYERRYGHPAAVARRQATILTRWCGRLPVGSSILELGCATGFVTLELAHRGYHVTGLDVSPAMIEVARAAAREQGVEANFVVGDIDEIERLGLDHFDAVSGFLATFFHYSRRPLQAIPQLARLQPKKLLVDFHRRSASLETVIAAFRQAGFAQVVWRPYLAPMRRSVPAAAYPMLGMLEHRPL